MILKLGINLILQLEMRLQIPIDFLLEGKRTTNISLEMGEAMNHQVNQNEYWMKIFLLGSINGPY